MSNTWFCSDLHFGHNGIGNHRKEVQSEEDNRMVIKTDWLKLVQKNDHVYVLGDACFTMETIDDFRELPGIKHLVRGNHDQLDTNVYLKYFKNVYGLLKYKEFWLSHAPIHPAELRGKVNLHGHVHYQSVQDKRYFNCCPENLWRLDYPSLISIEQIREILKEQGNVN